MMEFGLTSVILNGIFACFVAILATNILFSIVARLLNYDFIFAIETGRIIFELDEEFYSNFHAGSRGFLLHFAVAWFIMVLYTLVLLPFLAIVARMGPYIYVTPSGTAVTENLIYLTVIGIVFYSLWLNRDKNFDKFAFFFLIYFGLIIIIMGLVFGLYPFGIPGVLEI